MFSARAIPHSDQRYLTCGDWIQNPDGSTTILVSKTGNDDTDFLVALHELVEERLCKKAGITQQEVDDFDIEFEANRSEGDESEPGASAAAPYRFQHFTAEIVERIVAQALGVDWVEHESRISKLFVEAE